VAPPATVSMNCEQFAQATDTSPLSLREREPSKSLGSLLLGTRTTRLAARGGRLHRPGDLRAGPRDADVTGHATASVGHRTAASRGETNVRTAPTMAVPWHDRFDHSGVVVPAMPMPRFQSSGRSRRRYRIS